MGEEQLGNIVKIMIAKKKSPIIENSYLFRDAKKSDISEMINVIDDYYDELQINNDPLNPNKPPWIWINEDKLSFKVLLIKNKICGFFIARHLDKNSHLHSLFIKKENQGNGLGELLLFKHWKDAIGRNSTIQTLTLHIHDKNQIARSFYSKYDYKKIDQELSLLSENNGFGIWAKNCKEKDQWPLRKGIELYGISLKEVQNLI